MLASKLADDIKRLIEEFGDREILVYHDYFSYIDKVIYDEDGLGDPGDNEAIFCIDMQ